MKAMVCRRYGSPDELRLEQVPAPQPRDHEVLIEIHAASVNAADVENLRGTFVVRMGGPLRPQYPILGSDVAGHVVSVGTGVTRFRPGDDVFGDLSPLDGHLGAFAEYVCAPESALTPKPDWLPFEDAAAIPTSAVIALQALRNHKPVAPGQDIAINGAGGNVGVYAVQLGVLAGARVTAIDHAEKLDLLRTLGADRVIDFTQEDFTDAGWHYDLILDVVSHRSLSSYRRALRQHGLCILVGGSMLAFFQALLLGPWNSMERSKRIGLLTSWKPNQQDDMSHLLKLVEKHSLRPVIDRTYALSELPDAFARLESGRALGKLVIAVKDDDPRLAMEGALPEPAQAKREGETL